jgi:prolyl-tRNA editing enzyme YbaK/EbsC (Cys-tRNA(Pro) deacylase)
VNPEEICKTIIMRGRKSDKIAAVLLKGGDMINFSEAKKLFGEEMALATREQVKEAAGVEPGAVCPFLLTVSLLVDVKVMDLKRMNCGSGDHLYGLEIGTKDFAKVVEHKIVALAKTSVF